MLREHSNCFAIALTLSPRRAITRISTDCSWVNINGAKAVILPQVGQIYFGAVGQYYIGVNTQVQGCTLNTARTHARNLLAKTGCRRQAEVARLVQGLL